MLELTAVIVGILITTYLAVLGWLGKKTLDKVDKINDKVVEIVKAVYESDGTDRIREMERTINDIKVAVYDEKGNNGLIRKVSRLDKMRKNHSHIIFRLANFANIVIDHLKLKIEPVRLKEPE